MSDLVVIVPTRGRWRSAAGLAQAFASHCRADTRLMLAVGVDDPKLPEYSDIPRCFPFVDLYIAATTTRPSTMNHALHEATRSLLRQDQVAVGFMGDDHRPRDTGWDRAYVDALREMGTGIVYGDDLLQGERLPTQWAMTTDIVRALGHMAPPDLWHMYVDDYVRDLGQGVRCLRYLEHITVEHLHPVAGKATWDDSYRASNAPAVYDHDRRAYHAYRADGRFDADVAKVQALRAGSEREV